MLVSMLPRCIAKLDNLALSQHPVDKLPVVRDLSTALYLDTLKYSRCRLFSWVCVLGGVKLAFSGYLPNTPRCHAGGVAVSPTPCVLLHD
jgi:hypothetical protein